MPCALNVKAEIWFLKLKNTSEKTQCVPSPWIQRKDYPAEWRFQPTVKASQCQLESRLKDDFSMLLVKPLTALVESLTSKMVVKSTKMLPGLKICRPQRRFFSRALRSLIWLNPMQKVERLDCLEELEWVRLFWSWNWSTTLQRATRESRSLQVLESEHVKETTCCVKWLNPA